MKKYRGFGPAGILFVLAVIVSLASLGWYAHRANIVFERLFK